MNSSQLNAAVELPVEVFLREVESPKQVIYLLHGYSETGRRILRKLEPVLPRDALLLSPNAPFPIPVRIPEKMEPEKMGEEKPEKAELQPEPRRALYREGYSWYFYNHQTDEYLRDMSVALQVLVALNAKYGVSGLPVDVIGFSQGAYLAPFFAQKLLTARRTVLLAGRALEEELLGEISFEIRGIHGARDEIVDPDEAERSLEVLRARGVRTTFERISHLDHRIDDAVGAAIARIYG